MEVVQENQTKKENPHASFHDKYIKKRKHTSMSASEGLMTTSSNGGMVGSATESDQVMAHEKHVLGQAPIKCTSLILLKTT